MKKLTQENFEDQIVRYGFFAEQLPPCFSTEQLADKLPQILEAVPKKVKNTCPITISTYKNDISRRILSAPNPEAFLKTVKVYSKNWSKILQFSYSENSLSPITYLRDYGGDFLEEINSENIREAHKAKSDFIEGLKNCIRAALGYKYRMKLDIANCYNSIYTHSITWAICTKKKAKSYMKTKSPAEIKEIYELGDEIDKVTRAQKNNETNGIVVGPFTSRIFSEIILAAIDKELCDQKFVFRRYVDDYKFYFHSEVEAEESVHIIEKILNQFNLNLNLSKTEITRFPYEKKSGMQNVYSLAMEKDGIFGVLNAAGELHSKGEKGAYKYALKYIQKKRLKAEEFVDVFPLLVNIMLLDPKYGKYVIAFLKEKRSELDLKQLSDIANNELKYNLEQDLQQEALLFLYLIREIQLEITGDNIKQALRSSDDFSVIIALDIWKNRNGLVKRSRWEAKLINQERKALAKELEKENYANGRWLLLHEIEMHKFFPREEYKPVARDDFFKLLLKENVSFYIA